MAPSTSKLKNSEKDRVNTLICKVHKITLGLPQTTSIEKLLALAIRNTWEALHEAHKASQIKRLNLTTTGWDTLGRQGYRVTEEQDCRFKGSLNHRCHHTMQHASGAL